MHSNNDMIHSASRFSLHSIALVGGDNDIGDHKECLRERETGRKCEIQYMKLVFYLALLVYNIYKYMHRDEKQLSATSNEHYRY